MRPILAVLAVGLAAFGQTMPQHIPPDKAAKHLVKKAPPTYPQMAAAARIQGNVILEVSIDESGAASVRHLVSGHPMLAPAAIESVNRWKYQPFEVDGKPVAVVTLVMVTFGHPWWKNDAADRALMVFQVNFWTAEGAAEAALGKEDYNGAEQQLNRARDILGDGPGHDPERWQSMISMGRLAMARQKYDEAEQYYKKAQELRQNDNQDALEMAATLAELGRLYAEEKRYDLARDQATRSIALYQKNFQSTGAKNAGAREVYGRAIAYESWMLAKIALQQNDPIEAGTRCRTVLDFRTFLGTADRDSFVSACEHAIKSPTP